MVEVDRFSTQQKLKDYVKATSKMIDDMEFAISQKSTNNAGVFNFRFKIWRLCCFLIASIINIGLFFFFRKNVNSGEAFNQRMSFRETVFMYSAGILHFISSVGMVIAWFNQAQPMLKMDRWREFCAEIKLQISSDTTFKDEKEKAEVLDIIDKNIMD